MKAASAGAISPSRNQMQSNLLVGFVGLLLVVTASLQIERLLSSGSLPSWFWVSIGVSAGFAALVWVLRSATRPAACLGGCVCLNVLLNQACGLGWRETAMPSLMALFALTYAATHYGGGRKETLGVAEARGGRKASQVAANLGVAGIFAISVGPHHLSLAAMTVAALAEATADTLSSEMGQALGGVTLLITTGRPVSPGTDGGVSLAGTTCGVAGAAIIVLVSPMARNSVVLLSCFTGALIGFFFDSLLGATVERRGWLGNDLVNFSSTVVAAACTYASLYLLS